MRLTKLRLTDFGLYRGDQTIDLAPRTKYGKKRPVILIGGHNGAGKTTILDAVRLCLYGRLALGARVTDAEYHEYLKEHIHTNREELIQPASSAVMVEFDYSRAGETATYTVRRAWERKGTSAVTEQLEVLRNGKPLDDVESQFFPDFIRSLIPPGVSQLFFFDGERIKKLAEGHTESEALADSIKALLGLDLVERLQTDLDIYCTRQVRRTADGDAVTKLADLESELNTLEGRRKTLQHKEQELATKIQLTSVQIERAEQQLAQSGHGLATQRGELRQRKADAEGRIAGAEEQLREFAEGPLPLLLCKRLCAELVQQLESEARLSKWESSQAEVSRALRVVEQRLLKATTAKKLGLDATGRSLIVGEIEAVSRDLAALPKGLKKVAPLHGLSDGESQQITQLITHTLEELPRRVLFVTKELEAATETLRTVTGHLNRMPEADELAPQVKELSRLQGDHGALVADLAKVTEERSQVENEYAVVRRKKEKLLDSQAGARNLSDRVALAHRARTALDDYLKKLAEAKVAELQEVTLECFRRLSRKDDLVSTIRIDPGTYAVSLSDKNGRVVPREVLSAGEKQIFAIALLWSLARVSGRPLPMIIDTPLGRLDSIHRRKLVEHYFPVASHQVIILSTDTEVDREYFSQFRTSISHTIALVNHNGTWTEAKSGYFWQEEADAGIAP